MKTTHRIFPPVNPPPPPLPPPPYLRRVPPPPPPPPPPHTQIIERQLLRCVIQKAVHINQAAVPL